MTTLPVQSTIEHLEGRVTGADFVGPKSYGRQLGGARRLPLGGPWRMG